jgi:hypothetical protein
MAFEAFTHALHGQVAAPVGDAVRTGPLLAAAGRVVAVARGASVQLFDARDVADVAGVLGAGACKFRFLCSFPVTDIADPVTVSAVAFLRGGHLAVAGVCARGTGERDAGPARLATATAPAAPARPHAAQWSSPRGCSAQRRGLRRVWALHSVPH